MRVLVACEYSGTVRDAFIRAGHDAASCDLEPSESAHGKHHQCDIMELLQPWQSSHFIDHGPFWDLIILHPDCTKMAVCGNGTWADTDERIQAVEWTLALWNRAKKRAKHVCLEQPVSVLASHMDVKAQYIQPWQFGHPETKKTALFLHNLPKLIATNNVYDYMMTLPKKERHKVWYASPSDDRGKERSRFYTGIADAMANQWSTQ